MNKAKGYFYQYRGNGYGPFDTREKAIKDLNERYDNDTWDLKNKIMKDPNKIFYGTAYTKNKQLIKFEKE